MTFSKQRASKSDVPSVSVALSKESKARAPSQISLMLLIRSTFKGGCLSPIFGNFTELTNDIELVSLILQFLDVVQAG